MGTRSLSRALTLVSDRCHKIRKIEPLTEIFNALISEGVVIVLPRKLGLDKSLGVEGLKGLDNVEILELQVWVNGFEVLIGDEDTLIEKVLVDLPALVGGDQHICFFE